MLVPPAAPAAEPTTTYRQIYADAARDAVFGNPGAYLAGYRFVDPAGAVPMPATLRDQTSQLCDRQPMAFLCLTARHDGAVHEVRILHRFMRYLELPGEPATGFHDSVLGLLGDLRPNHYPVVEVPVSIFHLATAQVRVPTAAAMDGLLLVTWPANLPALGPYAEDGEVPTELVRPRNGVQLVPSRFAALLVHRENVTPRQAYVEIAGAIRGDDNDGPCADVITWLRAACTCRGGAGAQAMVPIVLQALPPVHLPEAVHTFVSGKITSDFPVTLRGGPAGVDPSLAAVVRALSARGMTGGEVREAKTVKDTYRETYPVLLRYSRVDRVEDVGPLWDRIANSHKSEHQTILQQEFSKVCQLNSEVLVPPTWKMDNAHLGATGTAAPLAQADVYVDDFLLVAQTKRHQRRLLRTTLQAIDEVFHTFQASDSALRKEPSSVKKLKQGDAYWSTQKRFLGWDLVTVAGTLSLPAHRCERLYALLDMVQPPRKRLSISAWHTILGERRSMAPGLPGSRGLFSILQETLSKGTPIVYD